MLISVIIPCHNVEEYIEECIQSVLCQSYSSIEIICIDNNSKDLTWTKLKTISQNNPFINIAQESKPGAPAARNLGLSIAKGEWIQFLDADDLLMPMKLEHQMNLLKENRDAGFIAGAYIQRKVIGDEKEILPQTADVFKSLFFTRLGITSSNLWNSEYITKVGGWDESLKSSQEADLMFRLLKIHQNVIFDNNPLTIIRERISGQISQTNLKEKWERFFYKRIEMMQWLKSNKREYYLVQEQVFQDGLFGILKILAIEDRQLAVELYNQHLGSNYKPGPMQEHSIFLYLKLLGFFGFNKAEKIRELISQVRLLLVNVKAIL